MNPTPNHKLDSEFLEELKAMALASGLLGNKIWFIIEEFVITGNTLPTEVADKILANFIIPLSEIRERINMPIYVSKKSGYRPQTWEWLNGRSGNSEHTFKGDGAADLVCSDMDLLLAALKYNSEFTRICYYPHHGFVHIDYKEEKERRRGYWEADSKGKWIFKNWL